jgi:hypothetical protein
MDDKLNVERLRELDAAATAGPWAYRPELHDDWGVVRAGRFWICQAKDPAVCTDEQLSEHRAAKTDPWQGNAELIPFLRNAVPAILAMAEGNARLREALERCRAIVQQHNHRQNEKVEDVVHIVNRVLGEPQS